MGRVLTAATAALFMVGAFAAPAGANDNSDSRAPLPTTTTTTTVAPTTTTAPPTTTTTTTVAPAPAPVPTPAPAPGPAATPTPRRAPAPAPTPVSVPMRPVSATVPPTTSTTVVPPQPAANATVDCVTGITVEMTNTGGEPANLTIVVDGNVVADRGVQPGGTEAYTLDLNPADAGTAKTVQVFHGDVVIYDQVHTVDCGDFAATPCEAAPVTAATPPAVEPANGECTSPCWWAPAALLLGVTIGRRRRNGKLNPAGIAAGIVGAFYALLGAGLAPLAYAGLAALAIAGAVKLLGRNTDDGAAGSDEVDASNTTGSSDPTEGEDGTKGNTTKDESKDESKAETA